MISILDVLGNNPFSRVPFTEFENLTAIRKKIAVEISKKERFQQMDLKKVQNVERDIEFEYYKQIRRKIEKSERLVKNCGGKIKHFRSYLYQKTLEKLIPLNFLA